MYGQAGLAKAEVSLLSFDRHSREFIIRGDGKYGNIIASSLPLVGGYSEGQVCRINVVDQSNILALLS